MRRLRILVVDDEPTVRQLATRTLGTQHDVEEAENATQALEKLAAGAYDVVVTDHEMPTKTGIRLLSDVAERWPAIRRVLMSGAIPVEALDGTYSGAVQKFLAKPFTLASLRSSVRRPGDE